MMKINQNKIMLTVISILLLFCIWALFSAFNAWYAFPSTEKIDNLNYSQIEEQLGKPSVVMEGKFIAWDKEIGFFKSSILVSHEKKLASLSKGLLIEKCLRLELGNISIKLYKMKPEP
ncbi:hypothetical protein [Gynuella sp.]|uniref:hypothetical protein n=1 Tax=Gynuella sp. TaxID=2969146 RepID=UPI003D0FBA38